ncbi:MAG: NAD(P)/FAD-dependent oxidoreductase [Verrucomicrobiota bacterium]
MNYDVAIIGGGHNGLVCGAYLAKAGLRTIVLERRDRVGGAVCTHTDLIPGYRIDVGSSVHIMIHMTPILDELKLCTEFGLEYIEMDPWAYYPIQGTQRGITFYRDVDRTVESIAQVSLNDARAYRRFVTHWTELNEGVFETFLQPPEPGRLFWTMLKRNLFAKKSRKLWSSLDTARQLMAPYGQLVHELFENESVRSALLWLSAQSGPGPDELASGDMLGWNAMIHKSGAWRAKGGSGALSEALERCLKHHGGKVQSASPVESLGQKQGQWILKTPHDEILARRVVSACHVQTLFGKLLKRPPERLTRRVMNTRVGNGFGMIVRHAVNQLPSYHEEESGVHEYHSAMQLLCPSKEHLQSSLYDYQLGHPPKNPSVVAMTFSAIDSTLAPEGKHTLFTWAQYHPYQLQNGEKWPDIAEREADKLYDLVCKYAPNMRGQIIDRYIQTPDRIEELHGLLKGNVMHLEMSLDQMFFFRPLPEMASYRTPLKGLYLTGASTHPGGGVFGASGRSSAHVVLKDLYKNR